MDVSERFQNVAMTFRLYGHSTHLDVSSTGHFLILSSLTFLTKMRNAVLLDQLRHVYIVTVSFQLVFLWRFIQMGFAIFEQQDNSFDLFPDDRLRKADLLVAK